MKLFALFLLCLGCDYGVGHVVKFFQSCPKIDAMPSLDVDKFLGRWYIIEVFASINKCMTLNFVAKSDTELEVTQQREFQALNSLNINYVNSYTGTLKIPDPSNAGAMTVKWPATGFLGKSNFIVVETDYDNLALLFECQYAYIFSKMSFTIVSRNNSLDEVTLSRLRQVVFDNGLDPGRLTKVSHDDCITKDEETVTEDFDVNIFGLMDDNEIAKIEQSQGESTSTSP